MKRVILLNNPKFVKLNNKLYEINTDFRIALKCNEIAKNDIKILEENNFEIKRLGEIK